jgi:hypothetical protein
LISHVVYAFKGTKYTTDSVNMTWYNGSLRPKQLDGIPKNVELPHQGSVFVGSKGSLILPHIGEPQVFNVDGTPMEKLPEKMAHSNHFHDWIDAAIGQKEKASAPFEYSGPLSDSANVEKANALLKPKYRTDW